MTKAECIQFSAKLAGIFWRSLAILILITAIIVQLARELTPIVNQHVDEVNHQLSRLLGLQIKIGEINSRWEGFRPNLRLKHVKIYGEDVQPQQSLASSNSSSLGFRLTPPPALHFQYLDVELDVLQSLREWRWVIGGLQLQHAQIRLMQQASGRWSLQGITSNGGDNGMQLQDPMDIFKLAEQVNIQAVALLLQMRDGAKHQLNLQQVRLEKQGNFHRFKADITLNSHKLAYLVLESTGSPRGDETGQRNVNGYLEVLQSALLGVPWQNLPDVFKKYLPIDALEQEFGHSLSSSLAPSDAPFSAQSATGRAERSPLSPFLSRIWFSSQQRHSWAFKGDWLFRKNSELHTAQREAHAIQRVDMTEPLAHPQGLSVAPYDLAITKDLPLSFGGQFQGNWHCFWPSAVNEKRKTAGKRGKAIHEWQVDWQNIQLTWSDESLTLPSGHWRKNQQEMRLLLPAVDLYALSENAQRLFSRPSFEKLRETLTNLSAAGQLHHVNVYRAAGQSDLNWQALTENVSVNSWKGIPGAQGVNGWAQGQFNHHGLSGQFQFLSAASHIRDSKEPLGLMFPKLFATPLYAKPRSGTIYYHWRPQEYRVWVAGEDIEARLPRKGRMAGKFQVVAPTKSGAFDGQLELALGFENISVRDHVLYTPKVLPDSARQWLSASLGDGRVPKGALLFRGNLGKGAPPKSTQLQLSLETKALDLAYHEDWPALSNISGALLVDNQTVYADITHAELWDTQIQNASVVLSPTPNQGSLLQLKSEASAPASNLIRIVRGTPLQDQLGSALGSWQSEGRANIDLSLDIPLSAGSSSQTPEVKTQLSMALALDDLYVSQADLTIKNITGTIAYDSVRGVTSNELQGRLWGEALSFVFEPTFNAQGKPSDHLLFLSGAAPPQPLQAWLKRPELDFIAGRIPFEGRMRFPVDNKPITLQVNSDLKGVSVRAPEPLGKSAETTGRLAMEMDIYAEGLVDLTMDYDPEPKNENEVKSSALNLRMKSLDEQLQGLALGLGQPARFQSDVIHIGGKISAPIQLPIWKAWTESYVQSLNNAETKKQHDVALDPTLLPSDQEEHVLPMQFALLLERVKVSDHWFDDWSVAGEWLGDEWRLGLRQNNLVASVYHAGNGVPLDIQVDKLMWPTSPVIEEDKNSELEPLSLKELKVQALAQDALADMDVEQIPSMKVRLADAHIGEKSLGDWRFSVYPLNGALIVDDIHVTMADFELLPSKAQAKIGASGAKLRWFKNAEKEWMTQFEGRVKGSNLAGLFKTLDQKVLLETTQSSFDMNLVWPGSPAAWDYRLMQGEVEVALSDGRFIQSAGAAGDAFLRLVSIFNFDSWARRLRLGLSDLYQDGMAFDRVKGRLLFGLGRIHISQPMVAKTPSGDIKFSGLIDLHHEQLDTKLVAVIPAGGNLTVLAGLAVGLPAAAGVYVVSKLLKRQVDKFASANYRVKGEWLSPKVRFIGLVDNESPPQEVNTIERAPTTKDALATYYH